MLPQSSSPSHQVGMEVCYQFLWPRPSFPHLSADTSLNTTLPPFKQPYSVSSFFSIYMLPSFLPWYWILPSELAHVQVFPTFRTKTKASPSLHLPVSVYCPIFIFPSSQHISTLLCPISPLNLFSRVISDFFVNINAL